MGSRLALRILIGVLLFVVQAQPPPALHGGSNLDLQPSHQTDGLISVKDCAAGDPSAPSRGECDLQLTPALPFQSQSSPSTTASSPNRRDYAGDEACLPCHAQKVESYFHTAHHLTSRLPTQQSILGSFLQPKNLLKTSNPSLYFRMDSKPDGFYQSSISSDPFVTPSRSERIDVVIGSGRIGQTYLYWKNDHLLQLPVSYWVDLDAWVNSPGYRDGTTNFERPVVSRCLECHLTYVEPVASPQPENHYKPATLLLGISCERCHGPARRHVESMTAGKPEVALVNLANLNRERQIEVCASCHGGRRFPLTTPFSYTPGEPLDKYLRRDPASPSATADVHGNQVALLQMSRCYQSSPDLVCSTCHDVHQTQRDIAAFSTRCLKCHQPQSCGQFPKLQDTILGGCVHCHMPVQPSKLIISNSNGRQTRAMVRSHWIKIYPELPAP